MTFARQNTIVEPCAQTGKPLTGKQPLSLQKAQVGTKPEVLQTESHQTRHLVEFPIFPPKHQCICSKSSLDQRTNYHRVNTCEFCRDEVWNHKICPCTIKISSRRLLGAAPLLVCGEDTDTTRLLQSIKMNVIWILLLHLATFVKRTIATVQKQCS